MPATENIAAEPDPPASGPNPHPAQFAQNGSRLVLIQGGQAKNVCRNQWATTLAKTAGLTPQQRVAGGWFISHADARGVLNKTSTDLAEQFGFTTRHARKLIGALPLTWNKGRHAHYTVDLPKKDNKHDIPCEWWDALADAVVAGMTWAEAEIVVALMLFADRPQGNDDEMMPTAASRGSVKGYLGQLGHEHNENSRRRFRRLTSALSAKGLIQVQLQTWAGSRGQLPGDKNLNEYFLDFLAVEGLTSPVEMEGGPSVSPGSDVDNPVEGGTWVSPGVVPECPPGWSPSVPPGGTWVSSSPPFSPPSSPPSGPPSPPTPRGLPETEDAQEATMGAGEEIRIEGSTKGYANDVAEAILDGVEIPPATDDSIEGMVCQFMATRERQKRTVLIQAVMGFKGDLAAAASAAGLDPDPVALGAAIVADAQANSWDGVRQPAKVLQSRLESMAARAEADAIVERFAPMPADRANPIDVDLAIPLAHIGLTQPEDLNDALAVDVIDVDLAVEVDPVEPEPTPEPEPEPEPEPDPAVTAEARAAFLAQARAALRPSPE